MGASVSLLNKTQHKSYGSLSPSFWVSGNADPKLILKYKHENITQTEAATINVSNKI